MVSKTAKKLYSTKCTKLTWHLKMTEKPKPWLNYPFKVNKMSTTKATCTCNHLWVYVLSGLVYVHNPTDRSMHISLSWSLCVQYVTCHRQDPRLMQLSQWEPKLLFFADPKSIHEFHFLPNSESIMDLFCDSMRFLVSPLFSLGALTQCNIPLVT